MISATVQYFSRLAEVFGAGWNRFWFSPADVILIGVLRIAVGLASFYFVTSHTTDLQTWFGPNGLLAADAVPRILGEGDADSGATPSYFRFSLLNSPTASQPTALWAIHIVSLLVIAAFTAGVGSRITGVLSLIAVLSYVNRAPMLAGPFESILTMALGYLCLGPTGSCLTINSWLASRRTGNGTNAATSIPTSSWSANLCLRLMQVHLAAFYLIMGLSKLGGRMDGGFSATWWRGEALWWLVAKSESRLIDLTFMHSPPWSIVLNGWTHSIVLFELVFPILIWNRHVRPLLLGIAIVMWISLALVTGLVSFCVMMLIANLVFVPADFWHKRCEVATAK